MCKKTFLPLLFILILASSFSYSQSIRIEVVPELYPGVLKAGQEFELNLYLTNDWETMPGIVFYNEFVGTDGVTDVIHIPQDTGIVHSGNVMLGSDFNGFWDMGVFASDSSWDGSLPDVFEYSGISMQGMPVGEGEYLVKSYKFRIDQAGTFTMEFDYPEMYDYFDWEYTYDMSPRSWEVVADTLCGNLYDNDDNIDILDILKLIYCLYMNDGYPCYLANADVNSSGDINIMDIIYLIKYVYKGGPAPECNSEPVGSLIGNTGCLTSTGSENQPPSDQDCFEYSYDGNGTLFITHFNSGFNCCPETLSAEIDIVDAVITISEYEASSLCDCECLFNLNYEISDLPSGDYTIKFIEPYRHENDPILEGTINTETMPSDTICVLRTFYPWGY